METILHALRYRTLVPAGFIPDLLPVLKSHYPIAFKTKRGAKVDDFVLLTRVQSLVKDSPIFADLTKESAFFGRTEKVLLDVVLTQKWDAESGLVKMLVFAALSESEVETITWILPYHHLLLVGLNLTGWNRLPFRQELIRLASNINSLTQAQIQSTGSLPIHLIGDSISRDRPLDLLISSWMEAKGKHAPFQIYLGSSKSSTAEVFKASKTTQETGIRWYVHAPFTIKLARPGSCNVRMLREQLEQARDMGCKGVVIHTGETSDNAIADFKGHDAEVSLSEKEQLCWNQMVLNVRSALTFATESCPLLLETPAGEKNEMLPFLQQLSSFVNLFSDQERRRLGICVDTCHVFAAGYHPVEYLRNWEQHSQVPIKLVHFNDSEQGVGCHRDKHAVPGLGKIGINVMAEVAAWCSHHEVPMVRET